ncbi:MAG: hypothetical protein IH851_08375 [Armatimonadetes bacterium]|nr:hypothetical protein [Armatimonadota bacterium]
MEPKAPSEGREVVRALDLMIQGRLDPFKCHASLRRLHPSIKQEWTPVERWVFEVLLDPVRGWADHGFEAALFPTHRDLLWLLAARWMCTQPNPRQEWGWLEGLTGSYSIDAVNLDLVARIADYLPEVPTSVDLSTRLECLIGIMGRLEMAELPIKKGGIRTLLPLIIPDEPWLDPVERRAREHFLAIGKSKKDERGRIEKLQREVATRYFEVVATSHQPKDKL